MAVAVALEGQGQRLGQELVVAVGYSQRPESSLRRNRCRRQLPDREYGAEDRGRPGVSRAALEPHGPQQAPPPAASAHLVGPQTLRELGEPAPQLALAKRCWNCSGLVLVRPDHSACDQGHPRMGFSKVQFHHSVSCWAA